MRIYELLLLLSALIVWIVHVRAERRALGRIWLMGALGAAAAHLLLEGYRWQLLPLYFLLVYLTYAVWFRPARRPDPQRRPSMFSRILLPVMWALSALLPVLLPIFELDPLTGPYPVGTVTYQWQAASREEPGGSTPEGGRELTVQLWYPAEQRGILSYQPALYMPEYREVGQAVQQCYMLPSMLFGYLQYIRTPADLGAPMSAADDRYPLVLFSHGLPGTRYTSTQQMEELASHGYLVAAIQHTGYASAAVLSDGTTVFKTRDLPAVIDMEGWDRLIQVWAADARTVLDQFVQLNRSDPSGMLTGRIDLNAVGMMGHSFGGAAAIQTLRTDSRFKAGINMDGTPFGQAVEQGLRQPLLQMKVEVPQLRSNEQPTDSELKKIGVGRAAYNQYQTEIPRRNELLAQGTGYEVSISGIKHMSFTDYYLWSPALRWADRLILSPQRARTMINAYALDFLDHYLRGKPLRMLNQPVSPYEEVKVRPFEQQ